MAEPELVVDADAATLAANVAERVLVMLAEVLERRERAAIALTAGSIMEKVWSAMAASPRAALVDWARVDVFWGDERFVPADSPDRNDTPAEKLLFAIEPFSAAQRYSMPTSDGEYGDDLDAAATGYAGVLRDHRRVDDQDDQPNFDIVLLGVGPDGHCCSLFPDHPGLHDESSTVIAVRNSPKPPPLRLSLSFAGLNAAEEIWVVASGDGKAGAVQRALSGVSREQCPSAGARGRKRTLWLVDADAASGLSES